MHIMVTMPTVDHDALLKEFLSRIEAEVSLSQLAKQRAESPPSPSMAVLYHEIAAADERHVVALETIAARYGHTPARSEKGAMSATLGRFKDKISELGSSATAQVSQDLQTKADAIHWERAWSRAFSTFGDTESAGELEALSREDQTHQEALQEALNRLLEALLRVGDEPRP
jgi:hypothetical protein